MTYLSAFQSGNLVLPSALLFHYGDIFDSADEFLVWQFIYMQNTTALYSLSTRRIAESLHKNLAEVNRLITSLSEKELLRIETADTGDMKTNFDASPALAKLDKLVSEEEEKVDLPVIDVTNEMKDLVKTFEEELGRMLSPMEVQDLEKTVRQDNVPPVLVKEALREAVLNNKPHWKYIHAIINAWRRQGIQSVQQVEALRQDRQQHNPETVEVSPDFLQAMDLWAD